MIEILVIIVLGCLALTAVAYILEWIGGLTETSPREAKLLIALSAAILTFMLIAPHLYR